MLPSDDLVDTMGFLARDSLDTVEITTRKLCGIVRARFNASPVRVITRFIMCSGHIVAFHAGM